MLAWIIARDPQRLRFSFTSLPGCTHPARRGVDPTLGSTGSCDVSALFYYVTAMLLSPVWLKKPFPSFLEKELILLWVERCEKVLAPAGLCVSVSACRKK